MQTIQKNIRGNQVTLTAIKSATETAKINRKTNFNGQTFVASRGETFEYVAELIKRNKILSCIKVLFHKTEPIVKLIFEGTAYLYNVSNGMWRNLNYDKTYFASSFRELVWKYVIGDKANEIKQSYVAYNELTNALNSLYAA